MLGLALIAMALIHFAQRRPNTYWLWIILMFPGVGALVYLLVEAAPDVALLRGTFQVFPRRRRIKMLQGLILDNPSVGNLEELGELLLEDKQYAKSKEMFDRVITPRTDTPDPYDRRALAEIGLGSCPRPWPIPKRWCAGIPKDDYHRAAGLLADTLGKTGQKERAGALFAEVTEVSTLSETQYNYCVVPRRRGAERGSARVGAADPQQAGDDAGLHAPPRAPLVLEGDGAPEAAVGEGRVVRLRRRLHRLLQRADVLPAPVCGRSPRGSRPSPHLSAQHCDSHIC